MTVTEFCDLHNACADGRKWAIDAGCATMAELWQREDMRPDWREWIATRNGVLADRELRLFACWCARQVWHLLPDERSRIAVAVAERYADGLATDAELEAARAAAGAAWAAAGAAWATARAARATARAAREAAGAAARAAAGAAVDAARAAADAAADAARAETRAAQSKWLIENASPRFEKGGAGE